MSAFFWLSCCVLGNTVRPQFLVQLTSFKQQIRNTDWGEKKKTLWMCKNSAASGPAWVTLSFPSSRCWICMKEKPAEPQVLLLPEFLIPFHVWPAQLSDIHTAATHTHTHCCCDRRSCVKASPSGHVMLRMLPPNLLSHCRAVDIITVPLFGRSCCLCVLSLRSAPKNIVCDLIRGYAVVCTSFLEAESTVCVRLEPFLFKILIHCLHSFVGLRLPPPPLEMNLHVSLVLSFPVISPLPF